jgi:hypothetical protein
VLQIGEFNGVDIVPDWAAGVMLNSIHQQLIELDSGLFPIWSSFAC